MYTTGIFPDSCLLEWNLSTGKWDLDKLLAGKWELSRQSNGRSNPEVVGSIPTEVKRFFLYLVWFPDSLY